MTSTPRRDATATAHRHTSSDANLERRGLSILDEAAWSRIEKRCWMCGDWTICAVTVRGVTMYELWKNKVYHGCAPDAATMRQVAKAGGGVS